MPKEIKPPSSPTNGNSTEFRSASCTIAYAIRAQHCVSETSRREPGNQSRLKPMVITQSRNRKSANTLGCRPTDQAVHVALQCYAASVTASTNFRHGLRPFGPLMLQQGCQALQQNGTLSAKVHWKRSVLYDSSAGHKIDITWGIEALSAAISSVCGPRSCRRLLQLWVIENKGRG